MNIPQKLADEFQLRQEQIDNTIALLDDGKTIPFIARYRKERTGSLDDQVLRAIDNRLQYLRKLEQRKSEILSAIESQGKLTPELTEKIQKAETLVETEDLYLPYRPKRKTRASMAIARGLEPLARTLMAQDAGTDPVQAAQAFLTEEVPDTDAALQGAMDILAEEMANDADLRKQMRRLVMLTGTVPRCGCGCGNTLSELLRLCRTGKAHRGSPCPRHRPWRTGGRTESGSHAAGGTRGIHADPEVCEEPESLRKAGADCRRGCVSAAAVPGGGAGDPQQAATAAIGVFASNLRQLLMAAPLKNRTVLGVDPGYRTGCKLAVVDETGKVLDTGVAHITLGKGASLEKGKDTIRKMLRQHHVTAVAIGNGTASRESEAVVAELLKELPYSAAYMVVSEAGASVYSASKLAAEEFPEYDVNLRSAVSIARRMQDPLAELVKIDPKAIGVGQYQHDMPQKELDASLNAVVEDCVNAVGVDLNTASPSLLTRVAGLNGTIAKNIVAFREENGVFTTRRQLLKVAKLGPKAFEQCAGFLRVPESKNVLDNTGVHPESYNAAKGLLELLGATPKDARDLPARLNAYGAEKAAEALGVGVPTLRDIAKELSKPGRDPRDELPAPILRTDVLDIKDLKPGMELTGTVRNVVDFGVFVDIGVHQDGLVHISQICDRFIKHPSQAVAVGDVVKVVVLEVDEKKHRISLSMRQAAGKK